MTPPATTVVDAMELLVTLSTHGAAMKPSPSSAVTTPIRRSTTLSRRRRQVNGEAGAAPERRLEGQRAAVRGHDRPGDREPEPRTAAFPIAGGVEPDERLEHALDVARRNAGPRVPHAQHAAGVPRVDVDLDEAPGRRELHRVLHQVSHRALKRRRVAEHRHRLADAAALQRDRKSTRLNSSHRTISYAVFCLKKKNIASSGQAVATHVEGHDRHR